jgi:hypothetical protein
VRGEGNGPRGVGPHARRVPFSRSAPRKAVSLSLSIPLPLSLSHLALCREAFLSRQSHSNAYRFNKQSAIDAARSTQGKQSLSSLLLSPGALQRSLLETSMRAPQLLLQLGQLSGKARLGGLRCMALRACMHAWERVKRCEKCVHGRGPKKSAKACAWKRE